MAKRFRAITGAVTIAIAGIVLSGCTINIGTSAPAVDSSNSEVDSTALSGMDIMFAQMMIPHHQQAVDMGTLAQTRASDPAVKALAAEIKAEQAPEIAQMEGWLDSVGASIEMGHEMAMGGMLNDEDFAKLEAASGSEFDRLFLEGMIAHHEGAIDMAQMIVNSNNLEAKALAEAIITSQTDQIQYMESLLGR